MGHVHVRDVAMLLSGTACPPWPATCTVWSLYVHRL